MELKNKKTQLAYVAIGTVFVMIMLSYFLSSYVHPKSSFTLKNNSNDSVKSLEIRACRSEFRFENVEPNRTVTGDFVADCEDGFHVKAELSDGEILEREVGYISGISAADTFLVSDLRIDQVTAVYPQGWHPITDGRIVTVGWRLESEARYLQIRGKFRPEFEQSIIELLERSDNKGLGVFVWWDADVRKHPDELTGDIDGMQLADIGIRKSEAKSHQGLEGFTLFNKKTGDFHEFGWSPKTSRFETLSMSH